MPVILPIKKLVEVCDPFTNPWTGEPFSVSDVHAALNAGELLEVPFSQNADWTRQQHLQRIAYLVERGWDTAVEVDVGVPSLNCFVEWPLTDGNHRLAAAVVRGDEYISASVGGDIDYAYELFGVDVTELV